jgi:rare lipoprotein A
MKALVLTLIISAAFRSMSLSNPAPDKGVASWYGEDHRGRLMANGKKFNPDRFTAASWFYPLGSKVKVTLQAPHRAPRAVLVTITDRGPAHDLVRDGRIIDLTHAAFRQLYAPKHGLVAVTVQPVSARLSR